MAKFEKFLKENFRKVILLVYTVYLWELRTLWGLSSWSVLPCSSLQCISQPLKIRFSMGGTVLYRTPVAEFIDPRLGDKVNSVIGLSYRQARLYGWRAATTSLCRSWLYLLIRDLWIRLPISKKSWYRAKKQNYKNSQKAKYCKPSSQQRW